MLSPAVITTRRVPPPPCPVRHRTDVSDSHSVDSQSVLDIRPVVVLSVIVSVDPHSVMDDDPVLAEFDLCCSSKQILTCANRVLPQHD